MKRVLLYISLIFLIGILAVSAQTINYTQIKEQTCDSCNSCSGNLSCLNFPDIGKKCAEPNPCNYYKCPDNYKCNVIRTELAMQCPDGRSVGDIPRVSCVCTGSSCPISNNENSVVTYDLKTKTEYTITSTGKTTSNNISIGESIPGSEGSIKIIISNNIPAKYSGELSIENSKLYMNTSEGKKEILILPDEAVLKAISIGSVTETSLIQESNKPVYSISGTKNARLLFIIPLKANMKEKISAESGNIISIKKPWWSFIAAGI